MVSMEFLSFVFLLDKETRYSNNFTCSSTPSDQIMAVIDEKCPTYYMQKALFSFDKQLHEEIFT